MTEARVAGPLEELLRFSLDDPIELDVIFCDLVHARDPNPGGPYELRLRGTRTSDGARVKGYVPLAQVEGSLLEAGAIAALVDTGGLPQGGGHMAVPLLRHTITLTKRRRGNGDMRFEVAVRDAAAGGDVAQYRRALQDAAEQLLPVLKREGYAVGAADVISIADTLFAVRINRVKGGGR